VRYRPFREQQRFHLSKARIRGAFAGKRGGKTEAGAVEMVLCAEEKRGYAHSLIDPPLGVIIAPTSDMLRRLSLQKFFAYGKPFIKDYHRTHQEIQWHNGGLLHAISADKPQRLEGLKANWVWIDEVFQVSEQLFLEAIARVSDTEGLLWVTGSLGTQYQNPKAHWVYKYFKSNPIDGALSFEWPTAANPYFPKKELERLENTLDPRTFRQMFEIDWNVPGTALVYDDFDEANLIKGYVYNPDLPTFVSVDWGWTHPVACLFFQYDPARDKVFLFDEIVQSKLLLENLYLRIMSKGYRVDGWFCDIAGNQEREQTGISNVKWFKGKGIDFKYRSCSIQHGVTIVRSYIRNVKGINRFFVDEAKCPKTVDNLRNYSYPQKNGVITNENPVKEDDDAVDAVRYYFHLRHDSMTAPNSVYQIPR
jgi:phage terminase large subunit